MTFATPKILGMVALATVAAGAFESPEHKAIGDSAWQQALAELKKAPADVYRLFGVKGVKPTDAEPICAVANGQSLARFSFGDMVAIYGDWAKDPPEINNPRIAGRQAMLKDVVAKGDDKASEAELAHMMALAKVNSTHFSGEALNAYREFHVKALDLAKDPKRVLEALHYEALALHSYTDLFAFGHMLENRERTKALEQWAQGTLPTLKGDEADSGSLVSLAKVVGITDKAVLATFAGMDKVGTTFRKSKPAIQARQAILNLGASMMGGMANYYHNAYNYEGATVRNSAGEEWAATGDGQYARKGKDPERQRGIIVSATASSLVAVLKTAFGAAPGPRYASMKYLPISCRGYKVPVPADKQMDKILNLAMAQELKNSPIMEVGFDWSMGFLKYQPGDKSDTVAYAPQIASLLADDSRSLPDIQPIPDVAPPQ